MWISKKKWNNLCDNIDINKIDIKLLYNMVNSLLIEHTYKDIVENINYISVKDDKHHKEERICVFATGHKTSLTEHIPDITLEELARLVIDGTPITRKVMEENIKEYGRME